MRRWWVLGGILGAALLTVLALTIPDGVRVGLAVVGCLLLPGLGWALKMRFGDLGDTVALAAVLSICSTVAVGTAMAVSGGWSLGWGLAALGVIAGAGFVPAGMLLERASAAVRMRIARFADDGGAWEDWNARSEKQSRRRRRRTEAPADQANDVWVDWYADAERRARDEQARQAAAVQAATEEWVDWYQRTHLLTPRPERKDDRP